MSKNSKCTSIGGQAVIEGVMMRGASSMATAVRDPDGNIQIESKRIKPMKERALIARLPIIRGVINFFSSLVSGTQITMRSAEVFGEDIEPSRFEKWLADKCKINAMTILTTVSAILGILLALVLFVFLPQLATNGISEITGLDDTSFWYNLIEGVIRLIIFILYLALMTLFKDVKRMFMYHGAEHKTIACYEKGAELTVENAKECSRVHERCGTTFMFLVMTISIIIFSISNSLFAFLYESSDVVNFLIRFSIKLALLPLVAGVSYELLKLLAKSSSKWLIPIKAPGLLLQRLTTVEPDYDMLEVAIAAFKEVQKLDSDKNYPLKTFSTSFKLSKLLKATKERFATENIDESDAEWLICISLAIPRSSLSEERIVTPAQTKLIFSRVEERLTGKPLWYIIGDTDFYGCKIKVDERVLIPRPETELLVEEAIKAVGDGSTVLDMCTGSGAIAVAIAKNCENSTVSAADVSAEALSLAEENAKLNGVKIHFIQSDMFTGIRGKFNVICCNPPYVKSSDLSTLSREVGFEPQTALDGGEDGLDFYRTLATTACKNIVKGGMLIMECGAGQAQSIIKLFNKFDYTIIVRDMEGIERIIKAVL